MMDIHYTLLMDIYDILLMVDKHKFIMSYNDENLNENLKYDIMKRYKMWLQEGQPLLINMDDTNKILCYIDTYELLCQPQYVDKNNSSALQIMCSLGYESV